MKKSIILICAALCLIGQSCCQNEFASLNKKAAKEYLKPIRPADEGRNPCWNAYCKKFIYAPAFEIAAVDGAAKYRFEVKQQEGEGQWAFTAAKPTADLSPIWASIPPSKVDLVVLALDSKGQQIDTVYKRSFLRDFPFEGPYNNNVRPYREAAMMAALYIHNSEATKALLTSTTPDTLGYSHYTYANKIVGGLISIEAKIAKYVPSKRDDAITIARNAAQFLIDQSRPEGDPLEFFPPTYYGRGVASKKPWNIGKTMTMDACYAGNGFLDLYDVTGDELYLDRALKIANTFKKIQREDGSFPIKVDFVTGEPVNEVGAMLHPVLNYIRRLQDDYKAEGLDEMKAKAEKWMKEVALETFDLTGQFEDVNVADVHPYENLTNCTAAPYASYILKSNPTAAEIEDARDLIRMSEDQFVHWNDLPNEDGIRIICPPCVYEQHRYQMPVDNSACNVANAYLDLYEVTGDKLAFAKAKALIDNITVAQDPTDGKIPTTWKIYSPKKNKTRSFWYNCSSVSITTLLRMADLVDEK
ncbi:MAG: hypothetical protein MJZ07_01115 [Bacteroidales bacterium]|nr:hypothetical protein [Bacteroidales bacterium]